MFAILGVQIFSMLDVKPQATGIETELNEDANFQTFTKAYFTLLRCATGENWNQIMYESAKDYNILH